MKLMRLRPFAFRFLLLTAACLGFGAIHTAMAGDLALFEASAWQCNLGKEFPGASGKIALVDEAGKKAAKLTFDFSNGGLYVAGVTTFKIAGGSREFRFQAKSASPLTILVRLLDSSGQTHQYQIPYTESGQWQELRVELTEHSPVSFGGDKDRVVHFPVSQIWLGVEKRKSAPTGEVLFSNAKLVD